MVLPLDAEKEPAGHAVHHMPLVMFPAGHALHCELPATEKRPVGHDVQVLLPEASWNVLAAHIMQPVALLTFEKVPGWQRVQLRLPPKEEKLPNPQV